MPCSVHISAERCFQIRALWKKKSSSRDERKKKTLIKEAQKCECVCMHVDAIARRLVAHCNRGGEILRKPK